MGQQEKPLPESETTEDRKDQWYYSGFVGEGWKKKVTNVNLAHLMSHTTRSNCMEIVQLLNLPGYTSIVQALLSREYDP